MDVTDESGDDKEAMRRKSIVQYKDKQTLYIHIEGNKKEELDEICFRERLSLTEKINNLIDEEISRKKVSSSYTQLDNYIQEENGYNISWKNVLTKKQAKELMDAVPENGKAIAIGNARTIWLQRDNLSLYHKRELSTLLARVDQT